MEEHQVSIDGQTHILPNPFLVVATQNPVEQEGTFPLPEAQLDRFLVRISMGYPGMAEESDMLDRLHGGHPLASLKPVVNAQTLVQMQEYVARVFVHPLVKDYLLRIVHATRQNLKLGLGGSPRASIALYRMAQAIAAIEGRNFVIPDDIKRLTLPVLGHRMIIKPEYRLRRETSQLIIDEILKATEAPANLASFRDGKGAEKAEIEVR
jgi:MoxR-like ATPase